MAQHRHKRDTNARTLPKAALVAAPVAVVATLSAVTDGRPDRHPCHVLRRQPPRLLGRCLSLRRPGPGDRDEVVSRSTIRRAARAESRARRDLAAAKQTRRAVRTADDKLWTAEDLNLWTGPGEDAAKVGLLDSLEKVLVTGRREAGRVEVVVNGKSRWVTAGYLTDEKPEKPEAGPSLGGACTNGTSIDAGRASLYDVHQRRLRQLARDHVLRHVAQATASTARAAPSTSWSAATTGWADRGVPPRQLRQLGIEYIIYSQKIWSVERGGEGWRWMSDRGSTTANHYDHVHVTVY